MGLLELFLTGLCLNATCDLGLENQVVSLKQQNLNKLADDLSKETLRISTIENGELSGYTYENGTVKGTGIAFLVIKILQNKFKFNYTVVLPDEHVFSSDNERVDAKRLLEIGKADLVAAFLPVVPVYRKDITYSRGFDTAEWLALMNRPKDSATGSGLLAPFTTPVWVLIIFSVLIVGPIIHLLILIQTKLCKDDKNDVFPLPACMWFVYGALLKQGSTLSPRTDSARLLFSTWWLFILILTAFYTANLTAFLTLSQFTLPITTPEDIGKKNYKWVTNKANGLRDIIHSEERQVMNKKDRLIDLIGNHQNYPEMDDMMILEDYVRKRDMMFIREKSVLNHVMYRDYKQKTKYGIEEVKRCTFVVAEFPIMTVSRAFAYMKDFKYITLFDKTIQHLVESGIVKFKMSENLPDAKICPLNLGNTERKLRNSDLLLTYVIVGGGLGVATCVFLIEILWRITKKKNTKKSMPTLVNMLKPIYGNNKKSDSKNSINLPMITPPPDYQSLFKPPLYYRPDEGHKKNINGRDYWVVKKTNGFQGLIPLRTPSALLFQYTN